MLVSGECENERVRVLRATMDGQLQVQVSPVDRVMKPVTLSNTSETSVWEPLTSQTAVITDIIASNTNGGTCTFRDGTTGTTVIILNMTAGTPISINLTTPIELSARWRNLTAQASAATWYITVCGWAEVLEE